jgi:hypothetical protein
MVSVTISVLQDLATPALRKQLAAADPHRVATRCAPPLAEHWRSHLAGLGQNKRGYPSTGFYEDAARRVVGLAVGGSVVLSCDKLGLRQRLHGGAIKAVHKRFLTIPVCAEAYGTTAADWGDTLVGVTLADGRSFLAAWLGDGDSRDSYHRTVERTQADYGRRKARGDIQARAAERATRSVLRFSEAASGQSHPRWIRLKASTGAKPGSRLEVKFLFRLVEETAPQAPNPDVVPDDLGELARATALEALKV